MRDRFRGESIGLEEQAFWNGQKYLRPAQEVNRVALINRTVATPVNHDFYVDQFSPSTFAEFDMIDGLDGKMMRAHGCGISALHVALGTLSSKYSPDQTVGQLAMFALGFHRNDLKDIDGNLVKKGTPVLANNVGWYHDALLYVSEQYGVNGHRLENVQLQHVANELRILQEKGFRGLSIISVRDNYKRPNQSNGSTHLVVASGFKFDVFGKLKEVMITDSSPYICNGDPVNAWVPLDKMSKDFFLQKAIILYTNR